ncbi:MAG: FHA domain-containing protein [Planctomycetota bacterium]
MAAEQREAAASPTQDSVFNGQQAAITVPEPTPSTGPTPPTTTAAWSAGTPAEASAAMDVPLPTRTSPPTTSPTDSPHAIASSADSLFAAPTTEIASTLPFRPTIRPPMAQLRVYFDDLRTFETHRLSSDRAVVGRLRGDILIGHDVLMSAEHFEIVRRPAGAGWRWQLRDLDGSNGVFVRVARAWLADGDEFLMGRHCYRFDHVDGVPILQHILHTGPGDRIEIPNQGICVGRDQSQLLESFRDDRLDRKHALIQRNSGGSWSIKNLDSLNGIWFRITEIDLGGKCSFQAGEQRFGFRV